MNAFKSCRELIEGALPPTRAAFSTDNIQIRIGPPSVTSPQRQTGDAVASVDAPTTVVVSGTDTRAFYEWRLMVQCVGFDRGLLPEDGCVYINPATMNQIRKLPSVQSVDLVIHEGGVCLEAVRSKGKETPAAIPIPQPEGKILYPGTDRFVPGYNPDGTLSGPVKEISDAFSVTSARSLDFGHDSRPALYTRKSLSPHIEAIGKASADFRADYVTDFLAWLDPQRPVRLSFWEKNNVIRLDTTDAAEGEYGYACCWFIRNDRN